MGDLLHKLLFFPLDFKDKLEFLQTKLAVGYVIDHTVFIFFGGLTLEALRKEFRRRAIITIHLRRLGDIGLVKNMQSLEINLHTRFPFP